MRPNLWDLRAQLYYAARNLDARVALDLVADAHVLVVPHADAALGAGTDLADVVLEAAQGFERSFEDHHVVAQHADRVVALDRAFDDHTARDLAELLRAEHFAHLRQCRRSFP